MRNPVGGSSSSPPPPQTSDPRPVGLTQTDGQPTSSTRAGPPSGGVDRAEETSAQDEAPVEGEAPVEDEAPAKPRTSTLTQSDFRNLERVLAEAQHLGFLGPGPITTHIERAVDLSAAVDVPPQRALDLGSGAGVPGLPLALLWGKSRWTLLDGSVNRASFLERTVDELQIGDRVAVLGSRAEEGARGELRGVFDLVVARSFAGPAVTAECGSPFLRVGGLLVVAEPPGGDPGRWDRAGLAVLGLELGVARSRPTAFQSLVQVSPCPERYPRRVGVPAKRPLF